MNRKIFAKSIDKTSPLADTTRMRIILSLLMSFVLIQAESAFARGPWDTGNGSIAAGGTYAGTFTGPANALGVFAIAIPSSASTTAYTPSAGLSTGDAFYFNGTDGTYQGIIVGVALPSGKLSASMDLVDIVTEVNSDGSISSTAVGTGGGLINAKISNGDQNSGGAQVITGSASLTTVFYPGTTGTGPAVTSTNSFIVTGFQQSYIELETMSYSHYPFGNSQQSVSQ